MHGSEDEDVIRGGRARTGTAALAVPAAALLAALAAAFLLPSDPEPERAADADAPIRIVRGPMIVQTPAAPSADAPPVAPPAAPPAAASPVPQARIPTAVEAGSEQRGDYM